MKTYSDTLLGELEAALHTIATSNNTPIIKAEQSVLITEEKLMLMKVHLSKHDFTDTAAEILFFKEIKPLFVSKLIYHHKIYQIELKQPRSGYKATRKYLEDELNKLVHYYANNREFFIYYLTGNNCLDDKYFLRKQADIRFYTDAVYFETDQSFATTHDYKAARVLAHERLVAYLENAICVHRKKHSELAAAEVRRGQLHWTESKTALTELIYALQSQPVIDHGRAEIKDIAAYFETMFNIDLGDYYRTFLELRTRKTGRTKFLDAMRDNLHKRMDEQEER